jgi:hypothetical protein
MKRRLEVDRMSTQQLWDRAFLLVGRLMPLLDEGPKDREVSCQQLEAVLDEIKLRGDQLQLFTAPAPCPPYETP